MNTSQIRPPVLHHIFSLKTGLTVGQLGMTLGIRHDSGLCREVYYFVEKWSLLRGVFDSQIKKNPR